MSGIFLASIVFVYTQTHFLGVTPNPYELKGVNYENKR